MSTTLTAIKALELIGIPLASDATDQVIVSHIRSMQRMAEFISAIGRKALSGDSPSIEVLASMGLSVVGALHPGQRFNFPGHETEYCYSRLVSGIGHECLMDNGAAHCFDAREVVRLAS